MKKEPEQRLEIITHNTLRAIENKLNPVIENTPVAEILPKLNIVVAQNKGGLGKTKTGIGFASVARNKDFAFQVGSPKGKLKVALFSADPENNKAMLAHMGSPGDPYTTFGMHNVNKREGIEDILNVLETYQDADIVITDFRANGMKFLGQITDDPEEYFELARELDFKTVLAVPIDGQQDSLQGLEFAQSHFGTIPIYVPVHRSTEADPAEYTRSRTKEYFTLVNEMRQSGKTVIEWDAPQLSKLVMNTAEAQRFAMYDEGLIETGTIPVVNRANIRKGYTRYLELYKQLLKA
jgi:hypothetical protein